MIILALDLISGPATVCNFFCRLPAIRKKNKAYKILIREKEWWLYVKQAVHKSLKILSSLNACM